MGRAVGSCCTDDDMPVLQFMEKGGNFRILQDNLTSDGVADAMRTRRQSRSRRAPALSRGPELVSTQLITTVSLQATLSVESSVSMLEPHGDGKIAAKRSHRRGKQADADTLLDSDVFADVPTVTVEFLQDHKIVPPAPGSLGPLKRAGALKAVSIPHEEVQAAPKRRKVRMAGKSVTSDATVPVGVPTPVRATIATGAALPPPDDQPMRDSASNHYELAQADAHRAHMQAEQDAAMPHLEEYSQLSMAELNAHMEERLSERLKLPQAPAQWGSTSTAAAKQFQKEFLQGRVESFQDILRYTSKLLSSHSQAAAGIASLGDMSTWPPNAKAALKQDRPAILAFKKLCRHATRHAQQQLEYAAVLRQFDELTGCQEVPLTQKTLFTRQEMEAGMEHAADEREAEVRKEHAEQAAAAPEPADPAMLPISVEMASKHSTNDRERDSAIQAIAYMLAPSWRLADMAASIEECLFQAYNENGRVGDKYRTQLKTLAVKMCPEGHDAVLEMCSTGVSQGATTDGSSASQQGNAVTESANALQQIDALQPELHAADSTRGKLWEGTLPALSFATGS